MKDKENIIDFRYGLLNVIIAVAASVLIHFCTQTHNSGIFCCTFLIQMALIFLYLKLIKKDSLNTKKEKILRLFIYSCAYLTTIFIIKDLVDNSKTYGDLNSVSLLFMDVFLILFFSVLILTILGFSFIKRNLKNLPAKDLLIDSWKNPQSIL